MSLKTCHRCRKVIHPSRDAAQAERDRLVAAKDLSPDVHVYRCPSRRQHWHIGHSQTLLRRRIRQARREGVA